MPQKGSSSMYDLNCDYPGCLNPIAARCSRCGRSFCPRHVQWIGPQSVSPVTVIAGHYTCDICVAEFNRPNTRAAMGCFKVAMLAGGAGTVMQLIAHLIPEYANDADQFGFRDANPVHTFVQTTGSILLSLALLAILGAVSTYFRCGSVAAYTGLLIGIGIITAVVGIGHIAL